MFDTTLFELKMHQAVEHLQEELKKIRTGRAHPDMLSGVFVESYGTKMPLNQVANITVPEPQLLQISPFDPSNVRSIVDAIRNDNGLGFNPSDDGRIVRVSVPALTEERRKQIVKQLGEKIEDGRIALRNIRQEALKSAKHMKDAKELGEDDAKRAEKEIDALMAAHNARIDEVAKTKEKEILTI